MERFYIIMSDGHGKVITTDDNDIIEVFNDLIKKGRKITEEKSYMSKKYDILKKENEELKEKLEAKNEATKKAIEAQDKKIQDLIEVLNYKDNYISGLKEEIKRVNMNMIIGRL